MFKVIDLFKSFVHVRSILCLIEYFVTLSSDN